MQRKLNGFVAAALLGAGAVFGGAAAAADAGDPTLAESGVYASEPTHAYITFSYLHQGFSRPFLRWRTWTANLDWNAQKPEKSSVTAEIKVASIDSGVDVFDGHLKSADWFDAEKHPTITFKSTSLKTTGDNTGEMTGDLTVKNITKPVTLNVTVQKSGRVSVPGRNSIKPANMSAPKVSSRAPSSMPTTTPIAIAAASTRSRGTSIPSPALISPR